MKIFHIVLILFLISGSFVWADVKGDINGDGNVGLQEAVYSLQVAAGLKPVVTVSPTTSYVQKTGQTKCYDTDGEELGTCEGTGQDGEWQKGVPNPPQRFTDNDDGTVTDNKTGLIWLKNRNCFDKVTWQEALDICNSLSATPDPETGIGACGLNDGSVAGDWRLPNRFELESLSDQRGNYTALPEGHPFGIPFFMFAEIFWSSTTHPLRTISAWAIEVIIDGSPDFYDKTDSNDVWPVRGGY